MACNGVASTTAASSRRPSLHNSTTATVPSIKPTRTRLRRVKAQQISPEEYTDTTTLATEINAVDKLLISVVRAIARNDFLWIPLAALARKEIFSIAEENDLWVEEYTEDLKQAGVEKMLEQVQDPSLQYPDYYLNKFHGYPDGNLNWKAAFEAKYSWMAISHRAATRRADWDPKMTIQEVSERWGRDCVGMMQQFCEDSGAPLPKTILDVGCSTGYSSRYLRKTFPDISITGIDASPYFLAVAETEERMRGAEGSEKIQYRHAVFEEMDQPENSVDMVYFQFMIHEVPTTVAEAALAKAVKVVRPGGIVGFADMNPRAAALAALPPAIKALRAASEPWLQEYEVTDFEALFERAGLKGAMKYNMDERHMGYFARVPL